MSKQELTSLLAKYFSNDITPAEKQALAQLIAAEGQEDLIRESVEDVWNDFQPKEQLAAGSSEAWYQRIMRQIKENRPTALQATGTAPHAGTRPAVHRVHFLRRSWVRMAAAAIVVGMIGTLSYYMLAGTAEKEQQQAKANTLPARPLSRYITLPDGSHVLLQANSKLDYPASFDGPVREVTLQGEAFFDVAHNPSQPFIIHSGKIRTTVLGTAFNIKAWPNDQVVTVTVTRGKVKVEKESNLLGILTPNQQISFNTQNESSKQSLVDTTQVISWKKEEYVMDNFTLDEAITELQVRYGIIIKVVDSHPAPADCRFTTSFRQDESLEYVMNVICKLYGATWKQEAGTIIIENARCK